MCTMGNVTSPALYLSEATAVEFHILLSRSVEAISSGCYHLWNWLLGSKPCTTARPKDSALLVVGAEEGIGRAMALKFAQQGYTVFACVPNSGGKAHEAEDGWKSTMSSLVYSWQTRSRNRRGRSASFESRGGSIIPLSFDYSRLEDRHRARETVNAYCARHSLQLSSLVLCPRQVILSADIIPIRKIFPGRDVSTELHSAASIPLSLISGSVWNDLIRHEVTEAVLVVQDFLNFLAINEGKVVVLNGCSEVSSEVSQGPTKPCDAAREAIARQFRQELSPLGISVSLIIAAPLSGCRIGWRLPSFAARDPAMGEFADVPQTLTHRLRKLTLSSLIYPVDEDTVFSVVSRAINSSYPKPTYYVGISIRIHRWAQLIPDFVWSPVLLAWNAIWHK